MSNLREEIEDILDNMPYEDFGIPDTDLLVDQILTLLDKEIHKARVEELEIMCGVATLPVRHTFEQYIADRIKQLEKGE